MNPHKTPSGLGIGSSSRRMTCTIQLPIKSDPKSDFHTQLETVLIEFPLISCGLDAMVSDPQMLVTFDREGNAKTQEVIFVTFESSRDPDELAQLAGRIATWLKMEKISMFQRIVEDEEHIDERL